MCIIHIQPGTASNTFHFMLFLELIFEEVVKFVSYHSCASAITWDINLASYPRSLHEIQNHFPNIIVQK